MAKQLKSFGMSGQISDDSAIPRLRKEYERLIDQNMRLQGYVPILDLEPLFHLEYVHEEDTYNFELVIYSMYIGKRRSQQYAGFSGQSLVPKD
jgi:hypothetical protein